MAELEAQLSCFTHLAPLLKETNAAQDEARRNLEASFKRTKSLCEKATAEREKLAEERAVFEMEREENTRLVQAAMEEYANMKEEYMTFHERTQAAEDRAEQSEAQLNQVQEALSASQQEKTELGEKLQALDTELTNTKEKLATFHGGFKEARQKNESLQQAYRHLQKTYQVPMMLQFLSSYVTIQRTIFCGCRLLLVQTMEVQYITQ